MMIELPAQRPTWAEINLDNLVHNFRVMRATLGDGVAVMPAVKADAYGHGAIYCARALEQAGADWFGVALPEEGGKLRDSGINKPILCLGGFWPGQEELLVSKRLTPVVYSTEQLEALSRVAQQNHLTLDYHLKVDTGMGRLGVPFAQLNHFIADTAGIRGVWLDGVLTHLASADVPDLTEFTEAQIDRFEDAIALIREHGKKPTWIHQANSAAAHRYPRARANLVRLGGVLYGLWRDATNPSVAPLDWQPVMSLRTRVMLVKTVPAGAALGYGCTFVTKRESRIATLPIGYEDGLSRTLSNNGDVIVRGCLAPIVGRVSMDLTLVDATDVAGLMVGDEVTLIGSADGHQITSEAIAARTGTLSYEVTCRISDRVPRVYTGGTAI